MRKVIIGGEIYTPYEAISKQDIVIEGDKIKEFTAEEVSGEKIDLSGYRILPGLIDSHIHGANRADMMDATYKALNTISIYKAQQGVTSFLPTTVTAPIDKIKKALKNLKVGLEKGFGGAKPLGAYVEGPFLNPEKKGAQPKEHIQGFSQEILEEIFAAGEGIIKTVALAPERENNLEAVEYLWERGVNVALAHTTASYEEVEKAVNKGSKITTHMYNGMGSFHHRTPGLIGATLTDDRLKAEVICDGIHVSWPAVEMVLRCKKKEDMVLITDAMRAVGLEDGEYDLGELKVSVTDGVARIKNGSLAGSTLHLIKAVENLVTELDVEFKTAVQMASANPASLLGEKDLGEIAPGKQADIIAIDGNYEVVFTMIDGEVVYNQL